MKIIKEKISKKELKDISKNIFGNMVKAVVDTKREVISIGGELHSDGESILLKNGSFQKDLWGINLYPDLTDENMVEFDSMINLRPSQNNLTRGVKSPKTQQRIKEIVNKLIKQ